MAEIFLNLSTKPFVRTVPYSAHPIPNSLPTTQTPALWPYGMSMNPNNFLRDIPTEARATILTMVMNGNTLRNAAKFALVSFAKLRSYLQWAEQALSDPDYHPDDYSAVEQALIEFAQSLGKQEAHREQNLLFKVQTAADGDWKAAMRLMAALNPEDWAEKKGTAQQTQQAQHQENEINALTSLAAGGRLDLSKLTTDELLTLEHLLAKARPDTETSQPRRAYDGPDRLVLESPARPKTL